VPKEITMPKLSDTMEEGKVLRWLKQEGDSVERGEILAEIETDKADMEMEAFDSGVLLEIRVKPGETAPVGEVIGMIGRKGEKPTARGAAASPREEVPSRSAEGSGEKSTEREDLVPASTNGGQRARKTERAARRREEAEPVGSVASDRASDQASDRDRSRRATDETSDRDRSRRTSDRDNAALPGPHADIADVIEPPESQEDEEGEEGSSRQAPASDGAPAGVTDRRAAAGPSPRERVRRLGPTKGINDRLPLREERAEAGSRLKISPVARRIAIEAGLDPAKLEGTGPDGRVTKRDVESALESRGRRVAPPGATASAGSTQPLERAPRPTAERGVGELPVPVARGELGAVMPLSKIRRAIATRMAESKRTVPHFYTTVAVRMDEALKLKDALTLRDPASKVSVTHLIVKAAALALERFPRVNGVFEEEQIVIPAQINIGVAVAIEDGLIVPVLKDCGGKTLQEIARDSREAVARVRSGKLAQDDLQGGTFSISNMGMFPIEQFAAILTPPQSAILAVGGTAEEAVVQEGRVVPARVVRLTLSADHRVIDGALAAAFLVELRSFLENPLTLLI
jgi:pyruvate dehydrogenase E2 component (dihydrolipoamide acetyltransferase)